MNDEKRNEIIKAHAYGYDVRTISKTEKVDEKTVKSIIEEAETIGKLDEIKKRAGEFYAE